jgi:hypothetical protein
MEQYESEAKLSVFQKTPNPKRKLDLESICCYISKDNTLCGSGLQARTADSSRLQNNAVHSQQHILTQLYSATLV